MEHWRLNDSGMRHFGLREYSVRGALVSICEAYPTDRNGEPVKGHEISIPGSFPSLDRLWYNLSIAVNSDYLKGQDAFTISDISDGSFLLTFERLVELDEREPVPERIEKWKKGEAFLYNARYHIEVTCKDYEKVSESEICKLLGVTKV